MRSRRLFASVPIADSTGSIVENAFHKGKPIESFGREIHLTLLLGGGWEAYWLLHGADSEPQPQTGPRAIVGNPISFKILCKFEKCTNTITISYLLLTRRDPLPRVTESGTLKCVPVRIWEVKKLPTLTPYSCVKTTNNQQGLSGED